MEVRLNVDKARYGETYSIYMMDSNTTWESSCGSQGYINVTVFGCNTTWYIYIPVFRTGMSFPPYDRIIYPEK